jgi:hypothetical protein
MQSAIGIASSLLQRTGGLREGLITVRSAGYIIMLYVYDLDSMPNLHIS